MRQWARLSPAPRSVVYREIWARAAGEIAADLVDLSEKRLELRRNGVATRVAHQFVALDQSEALELAGNKTVVHRLLAEAGLRVPEHLEFPPEEISAAAQFLAAADGLCVVKPASGTGAGWGVTPAVRRRTQLRRATLDASRYSRSLLIERQVDGTLYRLLFLDGMLLDAVRRLPPTVVGDGHSTIAELVIAENARRIAACGKRSLWLLRIDLDCLFTLELAGLRPASILPAGRRVVVKTSTSENTADDNATISGGLAPELVAAAARACDVVGLRLAGVDVLAADAVRSPAADAVVLEVNGTPGLSHHWLVSDPTAARPVAAKILERLLAEAESRLSPADS